MADTTRTTASTRFSSFDVYSTPYKHVGTHAITAGILIPKTLKHGTKHPLFVKFHGGGLITGDALYPDWFANFLVDFLHRTNSIAVLPNYRLVPEHSGDDILEDVRDLWRWVDDELPAYLKTIDSALEIDFDKVLINGDSAGGWPALHSAFLLPQEKVKALLLEYPMLRRLPDAERPVQLGNAAPPLAFLDDYLANLDKEFVISKATPPDREDLCNVLAVHYDRWEERFGTGKHLHPSKALAKAKHFPPTLILHGAQDGDVSLPECREFVEKVEEVLGNEVKKNVRLIVVDGGHGFDCELVEEETPWLKEELKWLQKVWLF
ncbi:alpha/beta-hydrolase [Pyrenochaeta sp. DS3sAY3a]|nr:alpha/beta-hydrolase [Pyrenochaeta sp. DS3sAY3a]